MSRWLPFERPLQELEERIRELEKLIAEHGIDRSREIGQLRLRSETLTREIFSRLTVWDNVLLARHPNRPYSLDYIGLIFEDFIELHGDRRYGDDPAVVGGLARLDGHPLVLIGQQKGRDVRERQLRNFGMCRPEGYRKALRLMRLAEKFGRPVVTLVDTPAAESRVEAEERGIAPAIAENLVAMAELRTPVVVAIIGEGGSGGAIGLALGDWVMMLENSIYSVIPPESCATIMSEFGRDPKRAAEAASVLRLNAQQTLELGAVDELIEEPLGGAHRDWPKAAGLLKEGLRRALRLLTHLPVEQLLAQRHDKFRRIGYLRESEAAEATAEPTEGSAEPDQGDTEGRE
jgi:acetyl-CoA carboxylase carboxyl transferase subunit alpha